MGSARIIELPSNLSARLGLRVTVCLSVFRISLQRPCHDPADKIGGFSDGFVGEMHVAVGVVYAWHGQIDMR
jgi:hypothetical protein